MTELFPHKYAVSDTQNNNAATQIIIHTKAISNLIALMHCISYQVERAYSLYI